LDARYWLLEFTRADSGASFFKLSLETLKAKLALAAIIIELGMIRD
jgi:hypothetical protein